MYVNILLYVILNASFLRLHDKVRVHDLEPCIIVENIGVFIRYNFVPLLISRSYIF